MATTGGILLTILVVVGILAPLIAPHDPYLISGSKRLLPPSREHLFGTDRLGRDVFSRVLYGTRLSLFIGVSVVSVSAAVGIAAGLAAGYLPRFDKILMRVADGLMAFPGIVLAIGIMAALGARVSNVIIALSVSQAPRFARVVRSAVLSVRERDFVQAAVAQGASVPRIMWRHILPNCVAPIIVQATLYVASSILAEASLSFLGAGVPPEIPSWGTTLASGRPHMRVAWWVTTFPGLAIMLTVLSLNLFGDGLRDALDPTMYRDR
jgi:peptide/nickel transport system permease protein